MKKKILIFSLAYYPKHIGGAEVAIKEITDRISSDEYEFHMVTNRYDSMLPQREQIGNVLVHRIGYTTENPSMAKLRKFPLHLNKLFYQWLAYRKACALHKEHQYHGIWAMMAHSCGIPAGLFKKKFPNVSYILTLQEGDPPKYIERKMRIFGNLFTQAFAIADRLQAISTFLERWGRSMGFAGASVVIPNAVDTKQFMQRYSESKLTETRAALGKKDGDVFLVTTSRLVVKNAVDDVIRALAQLPPHVHFIVFGTGPDEEMLRSLAASLNVTDQVQFRGYIDHKDMPLYLKACDIFIRPSRSEGMGNSFVEAMAAGLPVIATQEGGISDFLFDEKRNPDRDPTGWAVDVNNPEQIAAAVADIMAHPRKAHVYTINAQRMAVQKYDWNIVALAMKTQVFDQL